MIEKSLGSKSAGQGDHSLSTVIGIVDPFDQIDFQRDDPLRPRPGVVITKISKEPRLRFATNQMGEVAEIGEDEMYHPLVVTKNGRWRNSYGMEYEVDDNGNYKGVVKATLTKKKSKKKPKTEPGSVPPAKTPLMHPVDNYADFGSSPSKKRAKKLAKKQARKLAKQTQALAKRKALSVSERIDEQARDAWVEKRLAEKISDPPQQSIEDIIKRAKPVLSDDLREISEKQLYGPDPHKRDEAFLRLNGIAMEETR